MSRRRNKYDLDPRAAEKAIEWLHLAFAWAKTPQGGAYWQQVTRDVANLLDEVCPLPMGLSRSPARRWQTTEGRYTDSPVPAVGVSERADPV